MLDVYDWILSPEIREHMRAHYPLSLEEKLHIICGGFRSLEEKEAALQALVDESGARQAEAALRLYRLVLAELQKTGPEHLFVLPSACQRPKKRDSPITCEAALYSSYAQLLEHVEDICVGPHLCASKWEYADGKWECIIEFDVQEVKGVYCSVWFWLSDKMEEEWGIQEDTREFPLGLERLRCPIPFRTGDLVKLDGPMLKKPLFGVMDNALDLNGTRYMWMGYVDGNQFNVLDLSYGLLRLGGGYRVIDWLHSARPEELPEGEEILKEIGEYLSRQPRHGGATSDADDEFLDIFGAGNSRPFRRCTAIPFSELMAQAQRERGSA